MQDEGTLIYHGVRGLYFLSFIFEVTIISTDEERLDALQYDHV